MSDKLRNVEEKVKKHETSKTSDEFKIAVDDIKIREDVEEIQEQSWFSDYKLLGIIVGVVLVVLIIILAIPSIFKETPKTINELHQDVLDGKDDENNYLYNQYSFVRIGSDTTGYMWYTQILNPSTKIKYDIPLHYGPKEIEDIPVNGDINQFLQMMYIYNNTLSEYSEFNINETQFPNIAYFSFDPNSNNLDLINLAHHEIRTNMLQVLDVRLLPACTTDQNEACKKIAVLTCENKTLPIIVFNDVNATTATSIDINNNCITLNGYGKGIVKDVDRLLYKMYGIMS
ncbi:hypothetical protein J4434_05755 [Candidatus Woesearchaeota archaeon]|nr:hypothetical protein [Candidatus Woesearchaeota archaeon]